MKWEPKNIQNSILPIMILNWISGLGIIEIPLGKARPVLTFIYVSIIHFLYWFTYSNRIITKDESISETGRYFLVSLRIVNMFIASCSVLLNWFHYKVYKINIRRLELWDESLECLGPLNNYHKNFINSLIKVVLWVIQIGILASFDTYLLINLFKDSVECLRIIYLFHFPIHLNCVVDLNFTTIINCLGMRFESINSLLRRSFLEHPTSRIIRKLNLNYNTKNASDMSVRTSTRLKNKQRRLELLILVRHLHMELTKISCDMNEIYQKQIIMEMGSHFLSIIGLLYILFTIIFFSNGALTVKMKSIISISLWFTAFSCRFLNINSTCARVSSQSLKTRDILYELKISNEDLELKDEIEQFSLQLTQSPLAFTACGFSTLDYTFVQKFTGTVTTFLVILIQFSPEISD